MPIQHPTNSIISSEEYIERLWTEAEEALPIAIFDGTLLSDWPNVNAKPHWPKDVHWTKGTFGTDILHWLGSQHSQGYDWLMTIFRHWSHYERKGGGLHPDAPSVPRGLRPREGVEVGCGTSDCQDCYEPNRGWANDRLTVHTCTHPNAIVITHSHTSKTTVFREGRVEQDVPSESVFSGVTEFLCATCKSHLYRDDLLAAPSSVKARLNQIEREGTLSRNGPSSINATYLHALVQTHQVLPLSGDNRLRVLSAILNTLGVPHTVRMGEVIISFGLDVAPKRLPLQTWIELDLPEGHFIIDFTLWLHASPEIVPHASLFQQSNYPAVTYTADRVFAGEQWKHALALIQSLTCFS